MRLNGARCSEHPAGNRHHKKHDVKNKSADPNLQAFFIVPSETIGNERVQRDSGFAVGRSVFYIL